MNIKANIRTLTSEELETHPTLVKEAAEGGPVFIATDGVVTHVLMSKAEFDQLDTTRGQHLKSEEEPKPTRSLADVLAYDGEDGDFEWEPPRMGFSFRASDLD